MKTRCSGCGAIIQTEDIKKAGYIDKAVLEKHKSGDFYCKKSADMVEFRSVFLLFGRLYERGT